ncbi:hypothetical protein J4E91_004278 [Alternaria rosae]|nr:hypothetical protein J4E91_004278 [Alternaria rosae]
MIASDHQARALHGQNRLRDVDSYLDECLGFSIVVFIDYDCEAYHEKIKDAFIQTPMPQMPDDISIDMKPYFRVLQKDGPIADATRERLKLSESLEEALHALQSNDADMPSEWAFDDDLVHPYPKLYQYKHLFSGPSIQALDTQQQIDLGVLLAYVTDRSAFDHEKLKELSAAGLAFTVRSCLLRDQNTLEMDCWSWEYDGNFFQKHITVLIKWPSKSKEVAITDLSVYPVSHAEAGVESGLRQRGMTFWSCRRRKREQFEHEEPPDGAFILMLPATINGYGFHNKKWKKLLVKHIQDIRWNSGVFENRLVLHQDKKELVKALVTVHIESSRVVKTDFMDGKGEGLIILLHGGPGTGKTLTAESIAELLQRPMYRVTCGDLGTNAESVEKHLESALFIGNTWDCVVLLDEADVFLEERTKMDLHRNAIVSVFLRVLDYYDGILILTTNRIGTFDEAFKSRIQLALHYLPLNKEGRWEVWRNFVQSLSETGEIANKEEITRKLDVLARYKLNGRQIRNAINTARQLAQYKKEYLRYTHVDQAIRVVNEFEKYVADIHGHDDEEYARDQGLRNDDGLREAD